MKWIWLLFFSPLCGVGDVEDQIVDSLNRKSIDTLHKTVSGMHPKQIANLSNGGEIKRQINQLIDEELGNSKDDRNRIINRGRVKGAVMVLAVGGIAIYTTISSLIKATDDSDSEEHDYTTPTISIINSAFLIYYAGRELIDVIKNKHVVERNQRTLFVKYLINQKIEESRHSLSRNESDEHDLIPLERSPKRHSLKLEGSHETN
jgi:hypothetical protein